MLQNKKIGFLGGGQMSEAIFAGALNAKAILPQNVYVSDILPSRLQYLTTEYSVNTIENGADSDGAKKLIDTCDILVLAIKPQLAEDILTPLSSCFRSDVPVFSIIGGITLDTLHAWLPQSPLVRIMPNTPMMLGRGVAGIIAGAGSTDEHIELCRQLFAAVGTTDIIPERLANPFTAVSGCGPAFSYLFIESLAAAGVQQGLSHQMALKIAAETVAGAAEMVLASTEHPARLRDNVCSPGGGTIAGIRALEEKNFRAAVMSAVESGRNRMDELG